MTFCKSKWDFCSSSGIKQKYTRSKEALGNRSETLICWGSTSLWFYLDRCVFFVCLYKQFVCVCVCVRREIKWKQSSGKIKEWGTRRKLAIPCLLEQRITMVDGWWTSGGCWCWGPSRISCNQSEKGQCIDRRVWLHCYISKTSLLFPTLLSENDLKCTVLYNSPSPGSHSACHAASPAYIRLKPRHIALCYSISGL